MVGGFSCSVVSERVHFLKVENFVWFLQVTFLVLISRKQLGGKHGQQEKLQYRFFPIF